jgi:hypothetical protein
MATGKFSAPDMRKVLQRLWIDNAIYTRMYITSYMSGNPDTDAVLNRLVQNQIDIGNMLSKFYGKPNGDAIATLFKSNVSILGDLLKAIKNGDQSRIDFESKKWSENANSIAVMLSHLNPFWKHADMLDEFSTNIDITTQEISTYVTKDYAASMKALDSAMKQANHLAEVFGMGIYNNHKELF